MDYALIVAGGSGKRMQAGQPKQFLLLNDLPVLMHTINAFHDYSDTIEIILVLPESEFTTWEKLVEEYNFKTGIKVVAGGETRFDSVNNGLNSITDTEGFVAIHDGVRPFVTNEIINNCFKSARQNGSGVAVVVPKDSIRKLSGNKNHTVIRDDYRLMQTPQTFDINLIKEAYRLAKRKDFTDDASVAESNNVMINLVEGSYDNIKITTPEDLIIAQALIINKS
jgi:2-C-methyl-D-erythritol 4-phosphate cytidylyltransferase